MDAKPAMSLSMLYKNDPIYSLCASDLMVASQRVNNNYVHEQKQLIKTLRRLEQQRVVRLRQLDEEQKHFAFAMTKRLAPRGIRPTSAPATATAAAEVRCRHAHSAPAKFADHTSKKKGTSAKTATRGMRERSEYLVPPPSWHPQTDMECLEAKRKLNELEQYHGNTVERCLCNTGRTNILTRSLSCPPVLQRNR